MVTFSHFAAFLVNVEHVLAHHPVVCFPARFRLQCVEEGFFLFLILFRFCLPNFYSQVSKDCWIVIIFDVYLCYVGFLLLIPLFFLFWSYAALLFSFGFISVIVASHLALSG